MMMTVPDKHFVVTPDEFPALLEDVLNGQLATFTALLVLLSRDHGVAVQSVAEILEVTATITERDAPSHLSKHRLDVFYLRRLAASLRPSPKPQPLSFTVHQGGRIEGAP